MESGSQKRAWLREMDELISSLYSRDLEVTGQHNPAISLGTSVSRRTSKKARSSRPQRAKAISEMARVVHGLAAGAGSASPTPGDLAALRLGATALREADLAKDKPDLLGIIVLDRDATGRSGQRCVLIRLKIEEVSLETDFLDKPESAW